MRYFAGLDPGPEVPLRASTYQAIRSRGWVVAIDEFPFHRTTEQGLEALAAHEAKMRG